MKQTISLNNHKLKTYHFFKKFLVVQVEKGNKENVQAA